MPRRSAKSWPPPIIVRLWKWDMDAGILHVGDATIDQPRDISQNTNKEIRALEARGWQRKQPDCRPGRIIFTRLTFTFKF